MHQRSFINRIHRRKTTKEREREDKREREVVAGVKENILGKRSQSKAEK